MWTRRLRYWVENARRSETLHEKIELHPYQEFLAYATGITRVKLKLMSPRAPDDFNVPHQRADANRYGARSVPELKNSRRMIFGATARGSVI
jgi:hypothetical protein